MHDTAKGDIDRETTCLQTSLPELCSMIETRSNSQGHLEQADILAFCHLLGSQGISERSRMLQSEESVLSDRLWQGSAQDGVTSNLLTLSN